MVFLQVRLEFVSIISSAYPGFCSGLTNIAKHLVLNIYSLSKIGLRLRVEGILMPHLIQSPRRR